MLSAQPAPTPRPNRQRERTRRALMHAGQSLFAARGVDSVTIDEIVLIADVGKGSFYNHFEDKDALATAVYDSLQRDIEARIAQTNLDVIDSPERIARALCVVVRYAVDHPSRLQAMLSLAERRTDPRSLLNTGVTADVVAGLEQGRLSGVTVETGVLVVLGLTNVCVRRALSADLETSASALASDMAAAVLRGLGVDHEEARALGRQTAEAII